MLLNRILLALSMHYYVLFNQKYVFCLFVSLSAGFFQTFYTRKAIFCINTSFVLLNRILLALSMHYCILFNPMQWNSITVHVFWMAEVNRPIDDVSSNRRVNCHVRPTGICPRTWHDWWALAKVTGVSSISLSQSQGTIHFAVKK